VLAHDLSVAEIRRRAKQVQVVADSALEPARREALAVAVIDTGLSDAGLAARLQPNAPAALPTPSRQVDLRQLGSFDLFRQVRLQPLIDVDEAIAVLQKDLARLRREKRDGGDDSQA
jgi:hypothetical protein